MWNAQAEHNPWKVKHWWFVWRIGMTHESNNLKNVYVKQGMILIVKQKNLEKCWCLTKHWKSSVLMVRLYRFSRDWERKTPDQVQTGNDIKSEGARMLSEGLEKNSSLQKLMLGGITMKNKEMWNIKMMKLNDKQQMRLKKEQWQLVKCSRKTQQSILWTWVVRRVREKNMRWWMMKEMMHRE